MNIRFVKVVWQKHVASSPHQIILAPILWEINYRKLLLNLGGFLEFFVLKMISGRTHSTEEIRDKLGAIGFRTPQGSLYPLFTRLRRNGFIMSGYEESDSSGMLKTYCLTEKGRQRLTDFKRDWKRLNMTIASL